jgi:phage tail-like protein
LPTGLAVAPEGRLYLADPGGRRLLTYVPPDAERAPEPGSPAPWRTLWAPRPLPATAPADLGPPGRPDDPYTLVEPRDVALTRAGDLVVADAGAGRVLILVRPDLALRRVIDLDAGARPTAVGVDGAGRLYVVDPANARIHRLLADGRRDVAYAGGPGGDFAPEHLAVAADGALFALGAGRLVALDATGRERAAALPATLVPPPLARDEEGLFWPDPARGALRLPGVAIDATGRLAGTDLPLLARPRRLRRPRTSVFTTTALDGGGEGFAWDRIALVAEVPARTRIVVQTFTADARLEPGRIAELTSDDWSPPLALEADDLPEVLVQSPPGRHLWLRLELWGDGEATPRIAAIDVHAPRDSGLNLLPAPFHQDPVSAAFLDRFTSYYDTVLAEIARVNRDFPARLDPYAVEEGAFLDWLGRWFDWRFLAEWPAATRRAMIADAVGFFRRRGTVAGLRRLVQWHTGLDDPLPAIVEHFRLRGRDPAHPLWLAGGRMEPGATAHAFTVLLPATAAPDAAARATLEALIEAQKPAHTRAELCLFEPGVVVGRQAALGVDALLGGEAALGAGHLGVDATTEPAAGPRLGVTRTAPPC